MLNHAKISVAMNALRTLSQGSWDYIPRDRIEQILEDAGLVLRGSSLNTWDAIIGTIGKGCAALRLNEKSTGLPYNDYYLRLQWSNNPVVVRADLIDPLDTRI